MQKNPIPIIEGYGLTETSPVTHVNIFTIAKFLGMNVDPKIGSIGVPVVGTEAMIVKDNGQIAEVGEVGELYVRGPQVMKGYWEAESPVRDLWLPTGDLAYMDEDGFFYIFLSFFIGFIVEPIFSSPIQTAAFVLGFVLFLLISSAAILLLVLAYGEEISGLVR